MLLFSLSIENEILTCKCSNSLGRDILKKKWNELFNSNLVKECFTDDVNSKPRVPDRDPKNVEVTGTMKAYFCYWHTLL